MSTATYEVLAAGQDVLNVVAAFIGGLVVAGALIWAVRVGMRVMDTEEHRPRPEEQPRLPDGGAVHEMREMREPDEVPRSQRGGRITPHECQRAATGAGRDQRPRGGGAGSSGGFGSGGPGHV